jgi:2-methylcitrate synthase/citrate synthase II
MAANDVIHRGLDGVVVDTSAISRVLPETGSLVYRGYCVEELAERCSFEEVAYLLWHDDLPNEAELQEWRALERASRPIPEALRNVLSLVPHEAAPIDVLRTAVSFLGLMDPQPRERTLASNYVRSVRLLARLPTVISHWHRVRHGHRPIEPSADCGIAENFFHMTFGSVPDREVVKAFDASLTLYAEHGFNASTFAARVVTSTTSDLYSAVAAAIGALKGPLHGGANEEVVRMLQQIGDASRAEAWLAEALARKQIIMGFGHRVYKHGDSRTPIMNAYGRRVARIVGDTRWYAIADVVEKTMIDEKGIYPNLDFAAGPAYHLMGFETDLFTPIFAMARVTGWTAHIIEQSLHNRLIRPLSQYTGPALREVLPISARMQHGRSTDAEMAPTPPT